MTIEFDYAYGSGRFDRPADLFSSWLDLATAGASLAAGTEVDRPARIRVLYRLRQKGWAHHSGIDGDAHQLWCAWNATEWTLEARAEFTLTGRQYQRTGGATAPKNEALFTLLRHNESGLRLAHLVYHLPAGIEGHGGSPSFLKPYYRAAVWLAGVRGLKRLKRTIRKSYHPDAFMIGGDSNVNMARASVAAFYKALFPLATVNFPVFRGKGTLGKRFIDWFLLWGLVVLSTPKVSPTPASDHRWWRQKLAFKKGSLPV